jgi:hypothetical protein
VLKNGTRVISKDFLENRNNNRMRLPVITVTVTLAVLVACAHRNDIHSTSNGVSVLNDKNYSDSGQNTFDKYATKSDTAGMDLKTVRRIYKNRFGRDFYFKNGIGYLDDCPDCIYYSVTDEDELLLLKYALRNDTPVPLLVNGDNDSADVMVRMLNFARYEARFNRRVPVCKLADEKIMGPWPGYMPADNVCDKYLHRQVLNTLHKDSIHIPYDTIVVNKLAMWSMYYEDRFDNKGLPGWFQDYSDKDKVLFYEHALIRSCGSEDIYYSTRPLSCGYDEVAWPYLSRDEETSIKTELEEKMTEYERKFGRRMTEFETVKTEFEIQYGLDSAEIICKRCLPEELLMAWKIIIQMNTINVIYTNKDEPIKLYISEDIARSLYQKYSKRKMSAIELIVAEMELVSDKRIICQKCTDEELLMVWKHFRKTIDRRVVSDTVTVDRDFIMSLKKNAERHPCCRR